MPKIDKTPKKNRNGAPLKLALYPELEDILIEGLRKTLTQTQSAYYAGISPDTLAAWIKTGQEDARQGIDSVYKKFSMKYKKAQAEEASNLLNVLREGKQSWQSRAWILERCFRDDYAANSHVITELLDKTEKLGHILKNVLEGNIEDDYMEGAI